MQGAVFNKYLNKAAEFQLFKDSKKHIKNI
jgi:hypothetical protein